MLANLKLTASATLVAIGAMATTGDFAAAQGARGSLGRSQSGSLRSNYAGGISSGRATGASGARGGAHLHDLNSAHGPQ